MLQLPSMHQTGARRLQITSSAVAHQQKVVLTFWTLLHVKVVSEVDLYVVALRR